METEQELARKADALMQKSMHPQTGGDTNDDRNIPVLTDFVVSHDAPLDVPAQAATQAPAYAPAASILRQLDDNEIDTLSQDIFMRVTERMDRELAGKLEARLTHEINAKIKVAVVNVLIDMRQTIANEIGDAVNAALADKLR